MKRFSLLFGAATLVWLPSCGRTDTCPTSIAAYCAGIGGCPETWAAAQDAKAWKGLCASGVVLSTCAGVRTATLPNLETATIFFYDASTGALLRVEGYGRYDQCFAGAGPTETCNDPNALTLPCTP